ncbi:unnamed protein product [Prunus armeniaca]|uniref:Uncharacterized protein n=1 Tax=Prunus armeniaca TaxID=36596 RepID=A0A6J5V4U0_PRUAR|nr:unnamed protein product [Prunus armeniaca]
MGQHHPNHQSPPKTTFLPLPIIILCSLEISKWRLGTGLQLAKGKRCVVEGVGAEGGVVLEYHNIL